MPGWACSSGSAGSLGSHASGGLNLEKLNDEVPGIASAFGGPGCSWPVLEPSGTSECIELVFQEGVNTGCGSGVDADAWLPPSGSGEMSMGEKAVFCTSHVNFHQAIQCPPKLHGCIAVHESLNALCDGREREGKRKGGGGVMQT